MSGSIEIDSQMEVEEVEVKTEQPSSKEKKSMLSMLAEVASATLSPPNAKNQAATVQLSGKTIEQLKSLKPATLVELFADYKSDELKKKFTYTCKLIPEKCRTTFTSHGNEQKARQQIRAHLSQHLDEITREVEVAEVEVDTENDFEEVLVHTTHRTRSGSESSATMSASEQEDNVEEGEDGILLFHTRHLDPSLDGQDWSALEELADHYYTHPCGPPEIPYARSAIAEITVEEDGSNDVTDEHKTRSLRNHVTTAAWPQLYVPLLPNLSEIVEIETYVPPPPPQIVYEEDNVQYIVQGYEDQQEEQTTRIVYEDENGLLYEYDQPIEQQQPQQVVVQQNVPQSVQRTMEIVVDRETGEEYAVEYQDQEDGEQYEEVSYQSSSRDYEIVDGNDVIVYADDSQEVVEEDSVQWTEEEVAEQEISTNFSPFEGRVVYQTTSQMPRVIKTKGRTQRQSHLSQMCDEQMSAVSAIQGDDSPRIHNGRIIPEWEQKMAIQCLDALNERTEPDFVLQCKICNNNKTFTAAATLISHYRSHAGIKPFKCSICSATFTRQHSLKYHMLIHNNASRFTCLECKRQFRHPSHFKEHLRRHTGETPFECIDCDQRFKTRNTYKRHLKTRHNKLLSKDGIAELALEYVDGDPEGEVTEMVVIGEEYEEMG